MDLFFWLDRKVFKANYPKWDSLRLELIRRVCFFVCVSVNALIERNFTEVPAWDLGAFFSVSQPMSHLYYLIMSCFLGMNLNPIYRKISMFFVQRMPRMGKYIDIRYTPAIEINKSNCPLQDESRKKSPKQNLSFFQNTSLWRGGVLGTLPWSGLNFQMFLPMIWNWGHPVSWPRWTRSCKRVAVGYFGISRPTTMSTRRFVADSYGAFGVHVKELGGLGAGGWVKIEFLYLFFHLFSIWWLLSFDSCK